ncbi:DUF6048 family protein [Ekhidna sp.]|uniref:DUF6048 family protein n=1 Tax=Ekhidna sp. TaxID=2608089 RepID=UPI00329A545E
MVKPYLLFIFSLSLSTLSFAQTEQVDSLASTRSVTTSLYIDYGKLLTIPTNIETKYEGGLELLFIEKFPLIIEVGQAILTPEGAYSNGTYESEGTYFRVGTGYFNQFTAKNNIGISFRYASSTFSENGRIFISSPSESQEDYVQNIKREDLTANWFEIVLNTDMRLLKDSDLFRLGLKLRFRMLANYDEQTPIDVYSIPGYGRSFDKTIPAANFFLKVTF